MFNKIFNTFAVVLFSLELFNAGANFADNDIERGVISLVLAGLWGALLLAQVVMLNRRANLGNRLEAVLDEAMHNVGHIIARAERERNEQKANQSTKATARSRASGANKTGSRSQARQRSKATDKPVRSGRKGTSKKASN